MTSDQLKLFAGKIASLIDTYVRQCNNERPNSMQKEIIQAKVETLVGVMAILGAVLSGSTKE